LRTNAFGIGPSLAVPIGNTAPAIKHVRRGRLRHECDKLLRYSKKLRLFAATTRKRKAGGRR
jgi:hypothetical protein